MVLQPPSSTLFPYTTLFRSGEGPDGRVWPLAELIALLAKIEGLERIRYTTSHPRDMSDDLIAMHGSEKKLMPRSEEHTSELQSRQYLVCRLLLEKKKKRETNVILNYNHQNINYWYDYN